jgi:hypothetical protein
MVQVINPQGNIPDVRVGRIPEDEELNEGRQEKNDSHPGIAESLDELLDEHGFQPLPHGQPILF